MEGRKEDVLLEVKELRLEVKRIGEDMKMLGRSMEEILLRMEKRPWGIRKIEGLKEKEIWREPERGRQKEQG